MIRTGKPGRISEDVPAILVRLGLTLMNGWQPRAGVTDFTVPLVSYAH